MTHAAEASPVTAYIGVASNIAPEEHIERALALLAEAVHIRRLSPFYRTPPIGRPEQSSYLNGVAQVLTAVPPRTLKFDILRQIEANLGRQRTADRYAARNIDLDLLLYGDVQSDSVDLHLPDPDLLERPFLVAALLELDPRLRMPGGKALRDYALADTPLEADGTFTARMRERYTV